MDKKELLECIDEQANNKNIVIMTLAGPMVAPIEDFCNQSVDGILYDLNRDEATTRTLASDDNPRWVNDIAIAKVIRHLKAKLEQYETK